MDRTHTGTELNNIFNGRGIYPDNAFDNDAIYKFDYVLETYVKEIPLTQINNAVSLSIQNGNTGHTGPEEVPDVLQSTLRTIDDGKFNLNNKRLMITYRSHIDKDRLKLLFESKGQTLTFFRAAHETADSANPYEHTHVVVEYEKALQSKNCRVFDIDNIHPNIKVIRYNNHFTNCQKYLAKEDPDNADLADIKSKEQMNKDSIKDIWESKTAADAMLNYGNTRNASQILTIYKNRPEVKKEEPTIVLKGWQITLRNELITPWIRVLPKEGETEEEDRGLLDPSIPDAEKRFSWKTSGQGRNIITIYDPPGKAGKTELIKYLIGLHPERFYPLQGIPAQRDLSEIVRNAKEKGWTGETILINLTREVSDRKFYESLEALADGMFTSVKYSGSSIHYPIRNVVLFTNFMPKLNAVTMDRWDIRRIRNDGWMEKMALSQALEIYAKETSARKAEKAKEQEIHLFNIAPENAIKPTFAGIERTPSVKKAAPLRVMPQHGEVYPPRL